MWGKQASFRKKCQQPASASKLAFARNREVFQRENASFAQSPEMPESEPGMAPVVGQPYKDIPAFKWYCPMEQAAGVCQTCPGAFLRSAPLVPFHSN